MNHADLIDGDAFEALARRMGLVYVETHNLAGRMDDIRRMGRVIVLSHNSDGCIVAPGTPTREYDFVLRDISPNIVHWFGQNVDVYDDRLTCLPIGLERVRWYPQVRKHEVILSMPQAAERKLCYLNANTRIRVQREELYQRFEGRPWVTAERGHNGLDFEHYARQLVSHKFILCPDGNGLDTHRTWEALYCGAFPVVQRHVFTEYFSHILPLLVIDDWGQVTEDWLNRVYDDFAACEWNREALTMGYWERVIRRWL